MKLPWVTRAERAERRAAAAEKQRDRVKDQWSEVRALTEPLNREGELNGWTATVKTIFGGGDRA